MFLLFVVYLTALPASQGNSTELQGDSSTRNTLEAKVLGIIENHTDLSQVFSRAVHKYSKNLEITSKL